MSMSDGPSVIRPSRFFQAFTANLDSFKVLRTFGPDDAVLDPKRVLPNNEGWRVEVTGSSEVALFRMPHPGISYAQVVCRCRASVESVPRRLMLLLHYTAPSGFFGSLGFEPPATGGAFIDIAEGAPPGSLFEIWTTMTLARKSRKAPKEVEIRIQTVPNGVVNVRELTVFDATGIDLNPA
jgi:hypothetical protein